MTDHFRKHLHLWRKAGIDIFVLPIRGAVGCPNGEAWAVPASKTASGRLGLHINITGSVTSPLKLFVLLHEVGHHVLRHTTRRTSVPQWIVEKSADDFALDIIRDEWPALFPRCEQASKDHIRPLLQAMIDADIWNHVYIKTADWAGCLVPSDVRARLEETV